MAEGQISKQKKQDTPQADETANSSTPAKPVFVQIVGGDELEPFEEQTLAISRQSLALSQESFEISKKTYWIAILAFAAAAVAAAFVGVQVREMSYQTQIMASQTESNVAGAIESERNTRQQLTIAQEQATAAQNQAKAAQRSAIAIQQQTETGARPWIEITEIALASEITIDMDGSAHSVVHIVAENIGKTPAREVSLVAELAESYNEHRELQRLCTMSFVVPQGTGKYGQVLFPTDTLGKKENRNAAHR